MIVSLLRGLKLFVPQRRSNMLQVEAGRLSLPSARVCLFQVTSEGEMEVCMQDDTLKLDQMQAAYKAAVEEWISAIKQEEALASVNHSIAEVDKWEQAHFIEDKIRSKVKAAKKQYEDALREKFFHF
jgi:hypothetical protein